MCVFVVIAVVVFVVLGGQEFQFSLGEVDTSDSKIYEIPNTEIPSVLSETN